MTSQLIIPKGTKAHVFVVDRFSFPVHSHRLFCGVKDPRREWGFSGKWGLYATILCTRLNDLVFFYQRRIDEPQEERGFRGIYKIASEPFFDDSEVSWASHKVLGKCPYCGSTFPEKMDFKKQTAWCSECKKQLEYGAHILPNRIRIQLYQYYEKSVDDNTAYVDQTDPGTLWTMLFRKVYGRGRERSVAPILPEEAEKLIRLLDKVNRDKKAESLEFDPYVPTEKRAIKVDLGPGPKVKYEHVLQAWFMENIDKDFPVLKDILGPKKDLEWFGNEIIYGIGGDKVDILTLHMEDNIRRRSTVIELKDGEVGKQDVKQIERYSYWVSQLVTANAKERIQSHLTLQPVLVGFDFTTEALSVLNGMQQRNINIEYPWGKVTITIMAPIGLKYEVQDGKIEFDFAKPPSK